MAVPDMFDGREMFMLHDMFRREFGLMPEVVRRVAEGDRERAGIVSAHIKGVSVILHHHHSAEDERNWPLLLERSSNELSPFITLMERQHDTVAVLGKEVNEALARWTEDPSGAARNALAMVLEALVVALKDHLADEEKYVVPLMQKYITADEWNEMVRKGSAGADLADIPLAFGMLMYEGDPEVLEAAVSNMPEALATHIRTQAGKAYAAHAVVIHGTSTPPRSTEL